MINMSIHSLYNTHICGHDRLFTVDIAAQMYMCSSFSFKCQDSKRTLASSIVRQLMLQDTWKQNRNPITIFPGYMIAAKKADDGGDGTAPA